MMTAVRSNTLLVRTFTSGHLAAALAAVEKVNRRAERAGITGRFEAAHSTTVVETLDEVTGLRKASEITTFAVLGEPLRIGDYEFVATITWDAETGLAVTRVVPGVEVDLSSHRDAQVCEHCRTRRGRKDTYVVREVGTGVTTQVGSSCLSAFLGMDPSGALWAVDADLGQALDEAFSAGSAEERLGTTFVLGLASAAIRLHGWVPASGASPTRGEVSLALRPPSGNAAWAVAARARAAAIYTVLREDPTAQARADEVLAFIRSDAFGGTSEYVVNLKAACTGETIDPRNLGLVVSAVAAWSRYLEREIERAQKASAPPSTWQGEVKQRLRDLRLSVTAVRFFEGDYGTTTLLAMTDAAGNAWKWFASGTYDYAPGTALVLDGTVKQHEDWKGQQITVLTRCKIKEEVAP